MMHHLNGRVKFDLVKPSHEAGVVSLSPAVLAVLKSEMIGVDRNEFDKRMEQEYGMSSKEDRDFTWDQMTQSKKSSDMTSHI